MKKIALLLLVMVFAISVAAADSQTIKISEDQDAFDLYLTLPLGSVIVGTEVEDEYSITTVEINGDENLIVRIVTAPDELYAGVSLADLSDDEIAMIVSWYTEEMIQPSVDHFTSDNGLDYVVINEEYADGSSDSSEAISLVLGYEIMVSVTHADYSVLTNTEMTIAPAIVETLTVTEN